MIKVLTVIGARPQFIKAAAVSRALARSGEIQEILLHTGQHYDPLLSAAVFQDIGLPEPQFNLHVGSASHGVQTARMLEGIEEVILAQRPDWVLAYGDANSTLAGALAAAKLGVRVAHVEAGVRSHNRLVPEEINRIVTDHIAGALFCPTERALKNLKDEGITSNAYWVGDVMYDAFLDARDRALSQSQILARLDVSPRAYVLATIHRAENTDVESRLLRIVTALEKIHQSLPVVFPLHPRTRKMLSKVLTGDRSSLALKLIEPVGYHDMIALESHAAVIVTDSGGVQREAFWSGVPCVTARSETEWPETVSAEFNVLVGSDTQRIVDGVFDAVGSRHVASPEAFGDGRAAYKIAKHLAGAGHQPAVVVECGEGRRE